MAKSKAKVQARKATRGTQQIERHVFFERLRGPVLPGILGGSAVLVAVLSHAGVIPAATAVLWAGALALLLCVFAGMREFLDRHTSARRAAALAAFAVVWAAVVAFPLYRSTLLEPPLVSRELRPGQPPLEVPLAGTSGPYRVVVEGHLGASDGRGVQGMRYGMTVERGSASPEVLEGEFVERWSSRRLGRRGTAPVHVVRDVTQHSVDAAGADTLRLRLDSLVPPDAGPLTVHVHPDPFPAAAVVAAGVALTAAAVVIDGWREAEASGGLLTMLTLGTLVAVASLRHFGPPHPGIGDLLFNSAIGALGGWLGGEILWRATRRLR